MKNQEESKQDQELKQCQEGWQRTQADFENFRRRVNEERKILQTVIKTETLLEVAPIIDNFERAFRSAPKENQWLTGFQQIHKQLEELLKASNIMRIKTIGENFDPNRHEALSKQPNDKPADSIIEEVEAGWEQNGTILKPARVILSSGGKVDPEGKEKEV